MRMQAARTDTADRMLDLAERLVQTRGFNGFSYADIASALEVTKASLHYHFPTKAELGRRLIERYSDAFTAALAALMRAALMPSRSSAPMWRSMRGCCATNGCVFAACWRPTTPPFRNR